MKHRALEEELERLHPASFAWAMACCRWSRPDAEEVLQMAYFKVLEGRARYGGRATVKTWLFGVIRNTAADQRRRRLLETLLLRRWFVRREAPASRPPADELLAQGQRRERILDALNQLARRQREVLDLVELCEFGIWARSISPSVFGFADEVVAGGACLPSAPAWSARCGAVAC